MKKFFIILSMSIAMTAAFTASAQESDECSGTPIELVKEIPGTIIVCRDLNSFTAKELDEFEKSNDEIISFCPLDREICLRKKIK